MRSCCQTQGGPSGFLVGTRLRSLELPPSAFLSHLCMVGNEGSPAQRNRVQNATSEAPRECLCNFTATCGDDVEMSPRDTWTRCQKETRNVRSPLFKLLSCGQGRRPALGNETGSVSLPLASATSVFVNLSCIKNREKERNRGSLILQSGERREASTHWVSVVCHFLHKYHFM